MLFHDGKCKRNCEVCGIAYRPRVADQRFCGGYCRAEFRRREARSARRVWIREGRQIIDDNNHDLRCGRGT